MTDPIAALQRELAYARTVGTLIASVSVAKCDAVIAEVERLRRWLKKIGELPDIDADNRGWMAKQVLRGDLS